MLFFVLLPFLCDIVFLKKMATQMVPLPFGSVFFPCRVPQPISVVFVFWGVQKIFPCGACGTAVHSRELDSCVLSSSSPLVPCTVSNRVPERSTAARLTTQLRCTPSIAQTGGVADMSLTCRSHTLDSSAPYSCSIDNRAAVTQPHSRALDSSTLSITQKGDGASTARAVR